MLAAFAGNLVAEPLDTAFTCQGKLADSGNPANGSYDLTFILYDAITNGTQWGSPVDIKDCVVSNGLTGFTFLVQSMRWSRYYNKLRKQ